MEMKQKTDYFIIPGSDRNKLPATFQVVLDAKDEVGTDYLVGKLSSRDAQTVEDTRSFLCVYHSPYYHIEAKDSSVFTVYSHFTENPISPYLGRATGGKNWVRIPGLTKITINGDE